MNLIIKVYYHKPSISADLKHLYTNKGTFDFCRYMSKNELYSTSNIRKQFEEENRMYENLESLVAVYTHTGIFKQIIEEKYINIEKAKSMCF